MSDLLDGLVDGALETIIEGTLDLAGHAPALAEGAARGTAKAYRKGRALGVTGVSAAGMLAVATVATTRQRAIQAGITSDRLRASAAPLLARAQSGGRHITRRMRRARNGEWGTGSARATARRIAGLINTVPLGR